MIDLTVVLTAKNQNDMPELRDLLRMQRDLSLQEPGCLRFEAYESNSIAGTFILVERWESQAALDVHRTAHAFATVYGPKVLPLVDRIPHMCRSL